MLTKNSTDLPVGPFLGAVEVQGHSLTSSIESFELFAEHNLLMLTDNETSLQYIKADNLTNGESAMVTYEDYSGPLQLANSKSYRITVDSDNVFNSEKFLYRLATLHRPTQVIEFDLTTRMNSVKYSLLTYTGVNHDNYTSERILLPANDGEKIPVTLLYSKVAVRGQKKNTVLLHTTGADPMTNHNFCER